MSGSASSVARLSTVKDTQRCYSTTCGSGNGVDMLAVGRISKQEQIRRENSSGQAELSYYK